MTKRYKKLDAGPKYPIGDVLLIIVLGGLLLGTLLHTFGVNLF